MQQHTIRHDKQHILVTVLDTLSVVSFDLYQSLSSSSYVDYATIVLTSSTISQNMRLMYSAVSAGYFFDLYTVSSQNSQSIMNLALTSKMIT